MSTKHRHQIIPSVFVILRRNDEILLQRRFNTGFQDGKYTFPSGHIEANETPIVAVCREGREETGVTIQPEDVTFEQVLYRKGFSMKGDGFDPSQPERVDFFFSTRQWIGEPTVTERDKCDDVRWFPLTDLPENLFPVVRTFLENFPDQEVYKESGF